MATAKYVCLVVSILGALWNWNNVVGAKVCQLERRRSATAFKELFVGKCLYFQTFINPDPFCDSAIDCEELWRLFTRGFAHQPGCNVDKTGYQAYLDKASHSNPPNKQLFWSGLYEFVGRYTNNGKRNIAISDTLAGYIIDHFNWCGSNTSASGIEEDLSACPSISYDVNCLNSAYSSFWAAASINYASHAVGDIKIMLSANRSPAFIHESYFNTNEVPNINGTVVRRATIVLVHQLGTTALETCEGPSVQDLKHILERKGIQVTCVSNPRDVVFMLCADKPDAAECKLLGQVDPNPVG